LILEQHQQADFIQAIIRWKIRNSETAAKSPCTKLLCSLTAICRELIQLIPKKLFLQCFQQTMNDAFQHSEDYVRGL
jgi:hypothetical protein